MMQGELFCGKDVHKYLYLVAVLSVLSLVASYWYLEYYEPEMEAKKAAMAAMNAPVQPATKPQPGVKPGVQPGGQTATPQVIPAAAQMPMGINGVNGDMGRSPFSVVSAVLMPSVVNVSATSQAQSQVGPPKSGLPGLRFANPRSGMSLESIGSGVIVTRDGHVLTNFHVVEAAKHVFVTVFNEQGTMRLPAEVLRLDESRDLALLKIQTDVTLTPAPLGRGQPLHVGDSVVAIGSPFGLDQTVSKGIISGKRKAVNIGGILHKGLLQTDAAINRGNSGGPLANINGYVIGVNTAIYTTTSAFSGVGFAVPIDSAIEFMEEAIRLPQVHPNASRVIGQVVPGGRPIAARPPPPITADAALPHEDRGPCANCHDVLPAGATIPIAARPPPPIAANAALPHEDRGPCE
ncbi:MAG: trypsin-like peptidase domain-containing protein, partial [Magnetococcales bacterium]|nr:trypsin-like peptidase domain-containing protein [Magnetococcales bacterium]